MKRMIHTALKQLSAVVLGTAAAMALNINPASALTTQEVAQKLSTVPVYTMGILGEDNTVTFLQESIDQETGESVRISRVYLNRADAQNDLQELRTNNSDLPSDVAIATVSLGEVYCISQQAQPNQSDRCNTPASAPTEEPPAFIYFPDRGQLSQAVSILQEQGVELGENTPLFVPLFIAQFQVPDQEPRTVPAIYFSIENLQADIAQAQQEQPQLAGLEINVQVTTLARVIEQLKSQDDPSLDLVQFIPQRNGNGGASAPAAP